MRFCAPRLTESCLLSMTFPRLAPLLFGMVAASLSGITLAETRELPYADLGPWRVLVIEEDGKFSRCVADSDSASGKLRFSREANGLRVTVPCAGEGTQVVKVKLGQHTGDMALTPNGAKGAACRATTTPLPTDWRKALREEGTLTFAHGGQQRTWSLTRVSPTLEAVEACFKTRGR